MFGPSGDDQRIFTGQTGTVKPTAHMDLRRNTAFYAILIKTDGKDLLNPFDLKR
jgi:hypothetical protein